MPDWGALLRNSVGPAADVMAAHKKRDASVVEKQEQMKLAAIAQQRQAAQDDLQRRIGESTIARNNRPPVVAPTHWERFEAQGGLYERNPVTHEVRPIREPAEAETPAAPLADEGLGEQQMGARQSGDQQSGDIDLRTPPPTAPTMKPPLTPILQPKPPMPRAAGPGGLKEVMRNGKRVWVRDSDAVGQEAPAPEPARDSFTFPTVTDENGRQVVARGNTRTGELTPTDVTAKATASTTKLTEAQEKSHLFYKLMEDSEPQITKAMSSGKVRKAAVSAYILAPDLAKPLAQSQLNAEEQSLIRSFKDFAAGVLRKESGAAVTTGELREVWERYGPGFGDNPALDVEKLTARQRYMETMKQQAGPALKFYENQAGGGRGGGGGGITEQQKDWDDAATHLKAQGKDPIAEIGKRP